ncbi:MULTISPECIES: lipase family protein [Rhodococcus]|uniref:Lipase family protein n=1 Tax=Rhodococcus oxybenzonivorans TaxID=1990687 RepID=A0AAE4V0P1_9NOCA|nr:MULTISPECIES: lipase family protein [Rhodococcus]MDV7240716.1 lipase family protein [Rhodococcus oxybenzonivorans]MDV7265831.1 lipase family protein [Rhodococcus oxybenzonivorans]MDV7272989.1 lipase family protein [Rhodococcus oxybenzonivorans]MDV7333272.1 lipase family protein [Rhodococcus oxybenzonivorans]MDV7342439.1 lipase family protein [Rhodococcus oxybenzonivorans]
MRHRWRIVALLALVSVLWAPTVGAVPVRSDERPGTVIASSELPAELRLPGAGAAYRMTYRTTDRHGVTPCTGMLFVPGGPPPDGGWPVIAWAHGTVGNSDYDAPSVTGVDTESRDYVSSWLQRGYAVAATDYVGLGTPGVPPYLDGKVAGRSVVDSVRASREVDDTLSSSWVTVGLSQGGQASVFAAHAATTYAPELDYRGAVAGGVPSNIELVAPWSGPWFPPQGLAGLTVYMSYLIAGFRDAYPELDLDSYLTEVGRRLVDAAPELPFREFVRLTRNVSVAQMLSRGLDAPDLQSALREYLEVPVAGYDRPLLIVQGVTDPSVPFPLTDKLAADMRRAGTPLDYRMYSGGHFASMYQSAPEQAVFVAALFRQATRGTG